MMILKAWCFISEMGAILAAIGLTVWVRKRRFAFSGTLAGAAFLMLSFVVWVTFVAPMNAEFAQWTVDSIPANWRQVRNQWEYSHAIWLVLQLIGFSALLVSVLVEVSTNRFRDSVKQISFSESRYP